MKMAYLLLRLLTRANIPLHRCRGRPGVGPVGLIVLLPSGGVSGNTDGAGYKLYASVVSRKFDAQATGERWRRDPSSTELSAWNCCLPARKFSAALEPQPFMAPDLTGRIHNTGLVERQYKEVVKRRPRPDAGELL